MFADSLIRRWTRRLVGAAEVSCNLEGKVLTNTVAFSDSLIRCVAAGEGGSNTTDAPSEGGAFDGMTADEWDASGVENVLLCF